MRFRLDDEDHTIACILRDQIFKHNVTFGACTKYHPQDTHIEVIIESNIDPPREILQNCIENAMQDLEEIETHVRNFKIHEELMH